MTRFNVIGSTVVDLFFSLPRSYLRQSVQTRKIELPFGDKLLADDFEMMPGGSGANVAVGLARMGFDSHLMSGIGKDCLGGYLLAHLQSNGVKTALSREEGPTPMSVVLRIAGERTIITTTNHALTYLDGELPGEGWIHLCALPLDTDSFYHRLISHQVETGQPISINPKMEAIQERQHGLMNLIRTAKVLLVNQHEAKMLMRLNGPQTEEELLTGLLRLGPEIVCLTVGERGAYIGNHAYHLYAPAMVRGNEKVDSTGAGDGFIAGFLSGYLKIIGEKKDELSALETGLRYAVANSASVVNALGAQTGLLDEQKLEQDGQKATIRRVNAPN